MAEGREDPITCIYKVPDWLKYHECDGNDLTPYEPEVVSFGPYHWRNPRVKEMEKHKERCVEIVLKRKDQNREEYLREMREIEGKVRACYQDPYEMICTEEFAEMLVLDGCFMLEFLRVHKLGLNSLKHYSNDPIFSNNAVITVIARDMIKLENQLPLIVLEKLLSLQYKYPIRNKKHVPKLVLGLFTPIWIINQKFKPEQLKPMRDAVTADPGNKMLHCLDIFRSSLLYKTPEAQVHLEVGDAVEMTDNVIPVQMWLDTQPDPEMGQPSVEHVSSDRSAISFTVASSLSASRSDPASTNGEGALNNDTSVQSQTHVDDTSASGREEQPDPVMGLSSAEHVSLDSPASSYKTAFTSIPSNSRLCPPDQSTPDKERERDNDAKNMRRPISCLYNVLTRVMSCGQRSILFDDESTPTTLYSAEELRDAGVKFKAGNINQPFWDIKFDKHHGMLEIPTIKVNDTTKAVFLNLIAYEQCHLREYWNMDITDYVAFMDNLINTASDVGHLYNAGILIHQLANDGEVADLFNRLMKNVYVDVEDGRLQELYKELNRYCNHRRHRWRANWQNEYMKNPWVITSIIAAILLFLLTILQTAFAILPYSKAPKPN